LPTVSGGAVVLWLDETDSTNAEARRRAQAGEAGPLWIAARRQTAGQGRRGRSWDGGRDNLTATLLFTTDKPLAEAAGVSFVAALAVADLLEAAVPDIAVTLKWPNDVLLAARKTAGILVESGAAGARFWMAVGIGVNLASAPADMHPAAAAVADYADPPTPEEALTHLAERMAVWLRLWEEEGAAPILAAWTARAAGVPGPCVARLPQETVEGYAEGLDSDGALRLRLADGRERRIAAGDVFFGAA
jgi:BirA family biotin operon repressor/biotin-[acetyl-CoA-carboxylase] ligase